MADLDIANANHEKRCTPLDLKIGMVGEISVRLDFPRKKPVVKTKKNNTLLLLTSLVILTGLTWWFPPLTGLSIMLGSFALATGVYLVLGFTSKKPE